MHADQDHQCRSAALSALFGAHLAVLLTHLQRFEVSKTLDVRLRVES